MPLDLTCHVNSSVGGDAGDAEAGALLRRHTRGQQNRLLHGDHRVFGAGAERAVSLRGVTPHALPAHYSIFGATGTVAANEKWL